jgi:signal transduction histidine kinase
MSESEAPAPPARRPLQLHALVPVAIGASAFFVDLKTPDNVADGFLYILAVLACVWVPGLRAAIFTAAGLMVPMVIGFLASPPPTSFWEAALDRVLGATVVWFTAVVVWRNARLVRDRDRTLGQLRGLHGAAERAASAERVELSRWLHEGLAQELAAVGWGLDRLTREVLPHEAIQAESGELRVIVNQALDTVRGKAGELRDGEAGAGVRLVTQLEQYIASFRTRTGLGTAVSGIGCLGALPSTHATLCFKVVQEALTNVAKHACASMVWLEFREGESAFHVCVTDDGCGLAAGARQKPDCLGLIGLAERLTAIDGVLNVTNSVPHGVRLLARIPVH